jgi:hypothetical protein
MTDDNIPTAAESPLAKLLSLGITPGVELPQKQTLALPVEMRNALRVAWVAQLGTTPTDAALCVLMAQWAEETGRGAKCWNWNCGNMKYPSHVQSGVEQIPLGSCGDWQWYPAGEVLPNGHEITLYPPNRGACWYAYRTLPEGVAAYLSKLRARYLPAWQYVVAGDPAGFVRRIKQLGYFTASEQLYEHAVVSLWNEYMRLPKTGHSTLGPGRANPTADVVLLQKTLGGLAADGKWGPKTYAAVLAFQAQHGLMPDGVVGPLTWAALGV